MTTRPCDIFNDLASFGWKPGEMETLEVIMEALERTESQQKRELLYGALSSEWQVMAFRLVDQRTYRPKRAHSPDATEGEASKAHRQG